MWIIYKHTNKVNSKAKVVIQLDKNTFQEINRFPSAGIASKQTGVSRGNINSCCRGQLKTAGSYIWRYESN